MNELTECKRRLNPGRESSASAVMKVHGGLRPTEEP